MDPQQRASNEQIMTDNFYNNPVAEHLIDDDLSYNPLDVKPFDPADCLTEESFNS
jgi:hypothetical protein